MSTIREFYIEKEKRELINTINSTRYISEDQKEIMIGVLNEEEVLEDKYKLNFPKDYKHADGEKELRQKNRDLIQKMRGVDRTSDEHKKYMARLDKNRDKIAVLRKPLEKKPSSGKSDSRSLVQVGAGT